MSWSNDIPDQIAVGQGWSNAVVPEPSAPVIPFDDTAPTAISVAAAWSNGTVPGEVAAGIAWNDDDPALSNPSGGAANTGIVLYRADGSTILVPTDSPGVLTFDEDGNPSFSTVVLNAFVGGPVVE